MTNEKIDKVIDELMSYIDDHSSCGCCNPRIDMNEVSTLIDLIVLHTTRNCIDIYTNNKK